MRFSNLQYHNIKPGKWTVRYVCQRYRVSSFYDVGIRFWNCSDSVVFLAFHFIPYEKDVSCLCSWLLDYLCIGNVVNPEIIKSNFVKIVPRKNTLINSTVREFLQPILVKYNCVNIKCGRAFISNVWNHLNCQPIWFNCFNVCV